MLCFFCVANLYLYCSKLFPLFFNKLKFEFIIMQKSDNATALFF